MKTAGAVGAAGYTRYGGNPGNVLLAFAPD